MQIRQHPLLSWLLGEQLALILHKGWALRLLVEARLGAKTHQARLVYACPDEGRLMTVQLRSLTVRGTRRLPVTSEGRTCGAASDSTVQS